MSVLDREMETYRRELPRLLEEPANREKYVLIHKDAVAGIYDDLNSGMEAGYEMFLLDPFMVKKITANEKPLFSSRELRCPSSTAASITAARSSMR
jgi:hypothetical protein